MLIYLHWLYRLLRGKSVVIAVSYSQLFTCVLLNKRAVLTELEVTLTARVEPLALAFVGRQVTCPVNTVTVVIAI